MEGEVSMYNIEEEDIEKEDMYDDTFLRAGRAK